ncbi:MAG: PIG-L family deacetylase [Actinobacteria bacterium]|nr:PIG-L family deacetylase [Actinomycetota bacterium]
MKKLKILVVGGHPADVFDHCGGTLAHHIKRGDQVTALALTQGLRVHDTAIEEMGQGNERPDPETLGKLKQERAGVKFKEVKKACRYFGITDVRFMTYEDTTMQVTCELIEAVARVIRDVRPDIVITHQISFNAHRKPIDLPHDHNTTGKIVTQAITYASTVDFNDSNPAHFVPYIFFMQECATEETNCIIDVTDMVEIKVKALSEIKSQGYTPDFARKTVEVLNGRDGDLNGVGYAEPFVKVTLDVEYYLPVTEEKINQTLDSQEIRLSRRSKLIAPFVKVEGE